MKRGRKRTSLITRKKSSKNKRKQQKIQWKSVWYGIFVVIFILVVAMVGIGAGMYASISNEIGQMNMQELALARSSMVYYMDEDGNYQEAATLFSDGNCIWVESNEIPEIMKEAIVSIEDERFYSHGGVDIKRTAGAVFGYIKEKLGMGIATYGGSTITQQTIKNITQEKDRTSIRKIKEMMRAIALERQLSKDEILTMYLNVIYLGNNSYGVEAASNLYFNKPVAELTLTEAALIAGITQRPSYYDPLRNPDNAIKKRNTVLSKMYELEKITEEEYNSAVSSDLGIDINKANKRRNIYSYFVDTVVSDVIRDLQEQRGYSQTFATQQVFSGGLKIYTTMDINVQEALESVFENSGNFSGGAKNAQAAMVVIDHATGAIKGIIGGKGEKTESRGLNRATQTVRQPGSSFKPLSVYTPAIEKKLITSASRVVDEPISIKDWKPKNSYSGFKGDMSIKKAVEISANIPAIKTLQKVGLSTSYSYVTQKFKLSTIANEDRDYSPLALGGLTNGVTVKEMTAAYGVFANGGYYIEPYCYTKVLDSANKVLLEYIPQKERVINPATAYVMTDLLYGVVNGPSGTGRAAKLSNNIATYGKTGTTNNEYDKWFVGYTPYYVGGVWFGFDQQKSISSAGISSSVAVRLWKKAMEEVHSGMKSAKIMPGDDVSSAYVCTVTGKLAKDECESNLEYFIKGEEPKTYCRETHFVEPPVEEPTPGTQPPIDIENPNGDNQTQTPNEEVTPPPVENEDITDTPVTLD